MASATFKALLLEQTEGKVQAELTALPLFSLPEGDVLIKVAYAGLNYKDGLAITGQGKIARTWPMIPGIELAGLVDESASPDFRPGDPVFAMGWGMGETRWGSYAELVRLQSNWLIPLPEGLTPVQVVGIGTAGVTAMKSVMALELNGCRPENGPVVVTGAAGGVGSMSVAILGRLGYRVVASTGRAHLRDYLTGLGAAEVIDRRELAGPPARSLDTRRWAGAIDTVGGDTLATLLTMIKEGGSIAACGLVAGPQLQTTVYPFILRGVNLLGIETGKLLRPHQQEIWERLRQNLPLDHLDKMIQVAPLADVFRLSQQILAGEVRGRVVLDVQAGMG